MEDTEPTCEVQWFDKAGALTADDAPSTGRVRIKEHEYKLTNVDTIKMRGSAIMHFEPSRWFHICAEHAAWLRDGRLPNADLWEWEAR